MGKRLLASSIVIAWLNAWPTDSVRAQGMMARPPATPPQQQAVTTSGTAATRLYVKSVPPGAKVSIDGKPLGETDGLFIVSAGRAQVTVTFAGVEPVGRQVEIAAGGVTRAEFPGPQQVPGAPFDAFGSGFGPPAAVVSLRSNTPPIAVKPLSRFDTKLLAPIGPLSFTEKPLRGVVAELEKRVGDDILLDRKALEEAGIDPGTPITITLHEMPLASALDAICDPLLLTWIVTRDTLQITTQEAAAERLFTHVHDVSDLTGDEQGMAGVVELVTSTVDPSSWSDQAGAGDIRPDIASARRSLVVKNSFRQQWRLARLLAAIRKMKTTPADKRLPVGPAGYWDDTPATNAARAALAKPVAVDFKEQSMREVLDWSSLQAGMPIGIDQQACEEAGIEPDTVITAFTLRDRPLGVMLEHMLDGLDLALDLRSDRLLVTTKESMHEHLSVALYPLRDDGRDIAALSHLITTSIGAPEAWSDQGGNGTIRAIDGDLRCLVILQTTAVHRAIGYLLRSLE